MRNRKPVVPAAALLAALALLALVFTGCTKVKELPPLDASVGAENSARLVIPEGVKVKKIDGKKRGIFRTWSTNWAWTNYSRAKAMTMLIPAGTHSFVSDYPHSKDGWSARNVTQAAEFAAGEIYVIQIKRNEAEKSGIAKVIISGTATIKGYVVGMLPFIDYIPHPNPKGVSCTITQITQAMLDEFVAGDPEETARENQEAQVDAQIEQSGLDGPGAEIGKQAVLAFTDLIKGRRTIKDILLELLTVVLDVAVAAGIGILAWVVFMRRLTVNSPASSTIFGFLLVLAGSYIINYNSEGSVPMALGSLALLGAGAVKGFIKKMTLSMHEMAAKAYSAGQLDVAIAQCNSVISIMPSPLFYCSRGNFYTDQGELDLALSDFEDALARDPHYADAYQSRGKTYLYGKNDYYRAIANYNKVLKPHASGGPKMSTFLSASLFSGYNQQSLSYDQAYYNRGLAYGGLGDWERAKKDLEQAAKMAPGNEDYKTALAQAESAASSPGADQGAIDAAVAHCEAEDAVIFASKKQGSAAGKTHRALGFNPVYIVIAAITAAFIIAAVNRIQLVEFAINLCGGNEDAATIFGLVVFGILGVVWGILVAGFIDLDVSIERGACAWAFFFLCALAGIGSLLVIHFTTTHMGIGTCIAGGLIFAGIPGLIFGAIHRRVGGFLFGALVAFGLTMFVAAAYDEVPSVASADRAEKEQRIEALNEAIAANPQDASAYRSRSYAYASAGDYEKALADTNTYLALHPTTQADMKAASAYQIYWERARYLEKLGDYDHAIANINTGLEWTNQSGPRESMSKYRKKLEKARAKALKAGKVVDGSDRLQSAVVLGNVLNIRKGPGTNNPVVTQAKKGDTLTVTGAKQDGWLPVEYNGKEGFVSAELVRLNN